MASELAKILADFRTSLSSKIAIGGTSGTIQSATDDDGVSLPAGTYFFTIDGDNSQKEHIKCSLSGTNISSIESVSRQGVETSGTVREHRVGATVTITDFAHILRLNEVLGGTKELDSTSVLKYDADPTFTDDQSLITKKYADDLAIAGSPDASTTVKGISKLSTAPASPTDPIACGTNDPRLPTTNEKAAIAGNSGTAVSASNKLIDAADVDTAATASKIVRRIAGGQTTVAATPSAATDAASKGYVDNVSLTYIAGTEITLAMANTERTSTSSTYNKIKEITCDRNGTFTISTDYKSSSAGEGADVYFKIYKNGVAFGVEHTKTSSAYSTVTEDLSFVKGDLIQLYVKAAASITVSVKNFQVKGTPVGATVNTD